MRFLNPVCWPKWKLENSFSTPIDATTRPEREKCENDRKYPNRVNKKKRRSGKRPNCRVTAKTESHVGRVTLNFFFFAEPRKMRKCENAKNAKTPKPQMSNLFPLPGIFIPIPPGFAFSPHQKPRSLDTHLQHLHSICSTNNTLLIYTYTLYTLYTLPPYLPLKVLSYYRYLNLLIYPTTLYPSLIN